METHWESVSCWDWRLDPHQHYTCGKETSSSVSLLIMDVLPFSCLLMSLSTVWQAYCPPSFIVFFNSLQTPWTVAGQASLYMEFSRQEYWNGCHSLLQGIFLIQESKLGLPLCRQIFLLSEPPERPWLVQRLLKNLIIKPYSSICLDSIGVNTTNRYFTTVGFHGPFNIKLCDGNLQEWCIMYCCLKLFYWKDVTSILFQKSHFSNIDLDNGGMYREAK